MPELSLAAMLIDEVSENVSCSRVGGLGFRVSCFLLRVLCIVFRV